MLVTWLLLTCLTCDLMLHLHYNHFHIIPWMLLPTLVWMGKFSIFVFLNHQSEMVMRVSVSATISKYHVVQVYRQLMIWKIWEWRLWELEQGFNLSCFNLFIINPDDGGGGAPVCWVFIYNLISGLTCRRHSQSQSITYTQMSPCCTFC